MTFNKFPPKKPDTSHLIKPNVKHIWSDYQKELFRSIAKYDGHIIVEALAGAAKTSSIVEGFKYVPKGKNSLVLAFNKIIQEELRSRAPSYIRDIMTFHSLGFRAIKQRFGNVELDDYKVINLVKDQLGKDTDFDLITNIRDTVAFCKYGLVDIPDQIDNLIDRFGIDTCEMDRELFIKTVIKTLGLCKLQTNKIDFNDMCWMWYIYNLPLGQYDLCFIDERQDLNKSQLLMARKATKTNGGRIIAVGDENQACYSWRYADTSIIDDLKRQDNCKVLPLPISYRCPKAIIALCKNWVPDIVCPDTAIEGEINDISINELYDKAKPGCFILSRTNAPMIKIAMSLIRRGIKANIRGRDIGKQLSYLIKKSKKKQIPAFLKWLDRWKEDEVSKLKEKNINTENVLDRHECLVNICDECSSLEEVIKKIDELFNDTDEKNIIILSTTHRAKGLERDDVFVLRWTYRLWLDNTDIIEKPNEEMNLAYISISRCRKRLFIVHKFPQPKQDTYYENQLFIEPNTGRTYLKNPTFLMGENDREDEP